MPSLDELLTGYGRFRQGTPEAALTIGTGALADIPAGLGGIYEFAKEKVKGKSGHDAAMKAAERVEQLREKLTYQPRTEAGRETLGKIGKGIEWGGEQLLKLPGAKQAQADWEKAGSEAPALTAALTGLAAVVEPKGVRAAKRGAKAAGAAADVAKTAERAAQVAPDMPVDLRATVVRPDAQAEIAQMQARYQALIDGGVSPRARATVKLRREIEQAQRAAAPAAEPKPQAFEVPAGMELHKGELVPLPPPLADLRTPEGVAAFKAKYGRDPVHQMDEPTRVKHFGPAMAETPEVPVSDIRSRRQINMPGGFGRDAPPLTLADQAKISAQAIDYNELDPGMAQMLHERLVQSVDPGLYPSQLELANRLGFGITSGNAPITKNLIEHAASRPRSMAEMQEWADLSPGYRAKMEPEARNELNRDINRKYSLQSGEKGGIGVANTANKQYVADLNKMLLDKPEFFRRGETEPEPHFVERLMNTARGLGPKTGSLGFAMLEPQTSGISAIDRHIADLTREQVKGNPNTRGWYEDQMLQALNLERPKDLPPAETYREARARFSDEQAEAIEAERFRDTVSTPNATVFRSAKTGEVNPDVPKHLHDQPFGGEPKQAKVIGPQYQTALDIMEKKGAERGIGGFSNQWFDWDYKRSRAEPHAALNPMATEMKRMTPEEYRQVERTFTEAGALMGKAEESTGRLKPIKPTADFRRLIYGNADPALVAALLGLSGGAAGYGYLKGKDRDNDK